MPMPFKYIPLLLPLDLFQSCVGRKVTKVVLRTFTSVVGTNLAFNFKSSGIWHANLTSGRRSHRPPWHPTLLKIRKK
jgi:hypothetical protein